MALHTAWQAGQQNCRVLPSITCSKLRFSGKGKPQWKQSSAFILDVDTLPVAEGGLSTSSDCAVVVDEVTVSELLSDAYDDTYLHCVPP